MVPASFCTFTRNVRHPPHTTPALPPLVTFTRISGLMDYLEQAAGIQQGLGCRTESGPDCCNTTPIARPTRAAAPGHPSPRPNAGPARRTAGNLGPDCPDAPAPTGMGSKTDQENPEGDQASYGRLDGKFAGPIPFAQF